MAELIPFLGHVEIKKLTCNRASKDPEDDKEYIRIITNNAPRQIPQCQDGPGESLRGLGGRGWGFMGILMGVCGNNDGDEENLGEL